MALLKLEKTRWRPFFDRISKGLTEKPAEIEVAALELGAQVEATWLPLLGIVYDPKDDLIEIALENLDHLVRRPQEVYVEEVAALALSSMEVVDSEGVRHILRLREPLALPSPSKVGGKGSPHRKQMR